MQTKMEPSSSLKRAGEETEATTPAKKQRDEEPSPLQLENWWRLYLPLKEKHVALRPCPESYDPFEPRVGKLKKIIRILKNMDASIRRESSPPPSLSVVRMYNRIVMHTNTCIFLYHREAACSNVLPNPQDQPEPTADDIEAIQDNLLDKDEDVRDQWFFVYHIIENFLNVLKEQIASRTNSPSTTSSTTSSREEDEHEEEYQSLCLQQQQLLVDILYVLEKMAIQRKYAPPDSGEEIVCYKKIREWVMSTLMYVHTKAALDVESPATYTGNGKRWLSINPEYFPTMKSYGHHFAIIYELIPQCNSLIQRCKNRLKVHFSVGSSSDDQAGVDGDDDDDDDDEGVGKGGWGMPSGLATRIQLISEAEQKELEQYRLRILQQILDKVDHLGKINMTLTLPTMEEVRIYAQIEDHVITALWMAHTRQEYKPSNSGLAFRFQPSIKPDEVIDVQTREQHFREILSLLEPLELASLGVVPTLAEREYYEKILSRLCCCCDLKTCSGFLGIDFSDVEAMDKKTVAMLGKELVKLFERGLRFFADMKLEAAEMVNTVWAHGSSTPLKYDRMVTTWVDASTSSEDGEEDQDVHEPEQFFDWSSLESEQIKRAIMILQEANTIVSPIYDRLLLVNSLVKGMMGTPVKDYEKVAREINSAQHIMIFQEEAIE